MSEFKLSRLILPFYLPAFLWAFGSSFLLPVLPIHVRNLGASYTEVGVLLAMPALGTFLANIPMAKIISYFGKKRSMVFSLAIEVLVGLLAWVITNRVLLFPILFIKGFVQGIFFVTRLTCFRDLVPNEKRGRALSLLGGEARMGASLGPAIGGIVAVRFGTGTTFVLFAIMAGIVMIVVQLFMKQDSQHDSQSIIQSGSEHRKINSPILQMLLAYPKIFLTAGTAIWTLNVAREGRKVLFPLWGAFIGLSVDQIGWIFTLGYGLEMLLFYPAGWLMDTKGRKATGVPCLVFFVLTFILLPFTKTFSGFLLLALLSAFGNGLGSGINMTLSTDFAPKGKVVEFLSTWRVVTDTGAVVSPSVIGLTASALGLVWSAPLLALLAGVGALVMVKLPMPVKEGD
jgi:MFS family permease